MSTSMFSTLSVSARTCIYVLGISITQSCTCPGPGIHVLQQSINYPCITYSCIRDTGIYNTKCLCMHWVYQ